MNKVAVIGTGYVGLVTGTCLSDFGIEVVCVDNDEKKINKLKDGILPIYEPGLQEIVERNASNGRLMFTTDIKDAVLRSDVIFICVGTPPMGDGNADLKYVRSVAKDVGKYMNGYKVIVNKSTVPIGTGKLVHSIIKEELKEREADFDFDIVSNPEFLREGSAIEDFCRPDRIVFGCASERSRKVLKDVYRVLPIEESIFVDTDIETAEMIKYASNAFLALKITYINEIANLCEKVGANVLDVAKAMGRDERIGPKFLNAGPGFGGSCFPKDGQALLAAGEKYKVELSLVKATVTANENQKSLMVKKIEDALGNLEGKIIAVLGLAFKPNTDDMREAPSVIIINGIASKGAKVKVYDPVAMEEAKQRLSNIQSSIIFCKNEYEAVADSNAVVILTEWDQFKQLDLIKVKDLVKEKNLFDLRNIFSRKDIQELGFKYYAVGQ
ncbi:MAG: UDP-glucose/GDP-mannose dehydrogenase family protein [Clostridia bacterium]|nr:UDP-glucose/GDP-mannose dehydrogenase family protein [Clostridia bacterium]